MAAICHDPPSPAHDPAAIYSTWPADGARPSRCRLRSTVDDYEHFAALDVFERNLRSMAAIADNRDLPILLLTQATMYQDELVSEDAARLLMADRVLGCVTVPPDIASLARGMRAFNAVTTGVGSATFDLAARVPKSEMYMYDKCHFTRAGNALVAAELSPVVETILRASPDRATR